MSTSEDIYLDDVRIGAVHSREFTSRLNGKTYILWDHQFDGLAPGGGHLSREAAISALKRNHEQAAS